MRNRLALLLILCFCFVLGAPSQETHQQTEVAKKYAPTQEENALLWRISGKDLQHPSWLYGTIHIIPKEDFFLTDSTETAISLAQQIVFEINLDDINNLSTQLSLLMKSFMKDNKTLRDLLPDEDYQLVKSHFAKMGIPLFFFERMKPMFLTVFAEMDFSSGLMGGEDAEMISYEIKISDIAKKQKKKIAGLETIDFQMSMFDSIPYEAQAQMLVESIKSANAGAEEFRKMVEMYKAQDIYSMTSMLKAGEGLGGYDDLLLSQRNRNWIPVMCQMMKQQSSFFAVGAGHLAGESGVIALLRKEGYRVQPVW